MRAALTTGTKISHAPMAAWLQAPRVWFVRSALLALTGRLNSERSAAEKRQREAE